MARLESQRDEGQAASHSQQNAAVALGGRHPTYGLPAVELWPELLGREQQQKIADNEHAISVPELYPPPPPPGLCLGVATSLLGA